LQRGLTATVRLGEVDTVEYQRDRGLGLTVYFGKRKGSASTADLSSPAVRVYGNSHGFLGGYASTSHTVTCVLLAQQGEDMQRDYWYSTARAPEDLEATRTIGQRAGERAIARLGARKLGTRRAPVVFCPEMARGLYRSFLGAVRGGSQYRKASFLLDAAGHAVFPDFLQLRERPHIVKGLGSSPFD